MSEGFSVPTSQMSQLSQQSQLDGSQATFQADDEGVAAEWQQRVNDEKRTQDLGQAATDKPEVELVVKTVDPKPAVRRSSRSREPSPVKDSDVPLESPSKKRKPDEAVSTRPVRGTQKGRGSNARA